MPAIPRAVVAALVGGLIAAWAFTNFNQLYYRSSDDSPLLVPGALILARAWRLQGSKSGYRGGWC